MNSHTSMSAMPEPVLIRLSQSEALVLFEWLQTLCQTGANFEFEAERTVAWRLEGMIERQLTQLFEPNYKQLVAEARASIENPEGSGEQIDRGLNND